ncbi:hypothetical protein [Pyxidicoccus caerfyrddinensis]|uniref:hypothetical protein n=1 Tax=Pyxidicoccus caerfyrddinensis TaxID=2709663 RepID=UPI0013DA1752|nr:hypothetical protein [Pyxidicoccus caerfyrddinensis]
MTLAAKKLAILAAACLAVPVGIASAQEPESAAPPRPACGGFAGIGCPDGYSCVDDPNDDCDPNNGGADCAGVCTASPDESVQGEDGGTQQKKGCDFNDPNLSYVSKDPDRCAAIRFVCDAGQEPFFNDCGCGCQPVAQ